MDSLAIFNFKVFASCDILSLMGSERAIHFKRNKDNYDYYMSRGLQSSDEVRTVSFSLYIGVEWFREMYKLVSKSSGVEALGFLSGGDASATIFETSGERTTKHTVIDSEAAASAIESISSLINWSKNNPKEASLLIYQDELEEELLFAAQNCYYVEDVAFYVGSEDPAMFFFCVLESVRNLLKQIVVSRTFRRGYCVNVS